MKNIDIYVTAAFCRDGAGGNKAGVVFGHPELTNEEKMTISARLGYSETAFVTDSDKAGHKLEYFTPAEEVALCGHATIATFATLYHMGKMAGQVSTIETGAGILEVSVGQDGLVMMEQNQPRYYGAVEREELAACLGQGISDRQSLMISTGLKDMIVPFSSVEALHESEPDFKAITDLSRRMDAVGIHAFAIPSGDTGVDAVCRNFAPLYGIDEESATGTASCALAGYFWQEGNKKDQYIFEQGYSMDLPSRIIVKIARKGDEIDRIYAGGYGIVLEKIAIEI